MSHRYKTYVERIKEIDEKQSQVGKIIEEQNVNFFQWAIKKSFASEEELLKQINIYGSMKSYNTIKTIEDSLLVLVGFCKFISENSIKYLVDNNKAIEKYVNALQRLNTKGYIYRTDEKDINKSLYGLTEKGKKKLVDILGSDKTLPFSEFNYNTDGIAYHDAVVGQVYMRLLLMRKPFFFSRNYYQRGMLKSDDVYMDAVVSIKHGTEEESNYWIEGDTGTEGVNVIIEKIGKYYLKRLTQNEKKNFVLFVYKENDYNYCQDVYPGLYADVKRMDRINQMISYYDVIYLDEIQELIEDYLELPDEDEYWTGRIPFNSKSFAEALGEKTLTYAKYEMMKYLLYIKTLYFIGDKLMVNIRKMLGDKYTCNDTALMLGDYYKKYNNFYRIQHTIHVMHNIESTRNRRISLVKGIIKRFDKTQDVEFLREAIESIYSGIETICVPVSVCEAYLPFYMTKESTNIYRNGIKEGLERKFKHQMDYTQLGPAFSSEGRFPQLHMRNCYYYIDATNGRRKEIYVENISASLSAMLRVIILLNKLNGIIVDDRDFHVVAMVDCKRDAIQFNKLISKEKKVNNIIPKLLYLSYDGELFTI